MKMTDIMKAQEKANVKFELAKKIRALLDDARKAYGPTDWDADEVESEVLALVSEE